MKQKYVYFGSVQTIQVECPQCKIWQFQAKKCSECNYVYSSETTNDRDKTEYRSDVPTWRDKIPLKIREKVYLRDNFICQYCGYYCYDSWLSDPRQLTVDHIYPKTSGGRNTVENLVTCCRECNSIKGSQHFKSYEEAREFILERKKEYQRLV